MRRLRSFLLLATLTVASVAGTAADPASATGSNTTANVFGQSLDEFLSAYPNATVRSDGSFQLQPGVRLVPPGTTSDAGITEWPSGCPDHHFCLYQHREFGGWGIHLYPCTKITLAAANRNAVSSMHNAQNSPSAFFWDTGPSPDVQGALGPNRYLRNLAQDTAPDGRSWNDRIDVVDPC